MSTDDYEHRLVGPFVLTEPDATIYAELVARMDAAEDARFKAQMVRWRAEDAVEKAVEDGRDEPEPVARRAEAVVAAKLAEAPTHVAYEQAHSALIEFYTGQHTRHQAIMWEYLLAHPKSTVAELSAWSKWPECWVLHSLCGLAREGKASSNGSPAARKLSGYEGPSQWWAL